MNNRSHSIWKFLSKIKKKNEPYYTQCLIYIMRLRKDTVYKTKHCGLIIGMGLPERDVKYE